MVVWNIPTILFIVAMNKCSFSRGSGAIQRYFVLKSTKKRSGIIARAVKQAERELDLQLEALSFDEDDDGSE